MTFLLVVYLFMRDGTALSEQYTVPGPIEQCMTMGRLKGKAMHDRHGEGDSAYLCIIQKEKT